MKSLCFSTGELSGDLYAQALALAFQKLEPVNCWGMVGTTVSSVDRRWDNRALNIMGLSGVLGALPRLYRHMVEMADVILEQQPDGLVLIDSPDFHLPLARRLRCQGYRRPIVMIAPPTIWAWRAGRAKQLVETMTLCLPLFDFEAQCLSDKGVPVAYDGHPLYDRLVDQGLTNIKPCQHQIALMPGSRTKEIRSLLPVLIELRKPLQNRGFQTVLSCVSGLNEKIRDWMLDQWQGDLFEGNGQQLVAESQLVIGASGTLSVEALMLNRPMAVLYRCSALEGFVARMVLKTPYVAIPNLLGEGEIYPEFLQQRCEAKLILQWIDRWLQDQGYATELEEKIMRCSLKLKRVGVIDRWARRIIELM